MGQKRVFRGRFESFLDSPIKMVKGSKPFSFKPLAMAEDEGFEPPWDCSQTVFKTAAL